MEQTASQGHRRDERTDPLEVRLSVSPVNHGGCHCSDWDARDVKQSLSIDEDGTVHCNITVHCEDGVRYVQTDTDEEICPCAILSRHECVQSLEEIRDGRLIFSMTIPERECLPKVVGGLREAGFTVSVDQIRNLVDTSESTPTLTDKQREAFETAIEVGYYERPRGGDLGDIAERLDITASAASQRLTSVKRRLAKRYARRLGTESEE